jgi:hypothetical protein
MEHPEDDYYSHESGGNGYCGDCQLVTHCSTAASLVCLRYACCVFSQFGNAHGHGFVTFDAVSGEVFRVVGRGATSTNTPTPTAA